MISQIPVSEAVEDHRDRQNGTILVLRTVSTNERAFSEAVTLMKRIRFKYLFHGTSSVFRQGIEKEGLLLVNGTLHLTRDPSLAWDEANWTVNSEDPRYGDKHAVSGKPLVVMLKSIAVLSPP